MFKYIFYFFISLFYLGVTAQNDVDALRYSRNGVNGTSRFVAMGGAFGAIGADISCAANNPAGLGLFKSDNASYGFGLKTTGNKGTVNNTTSEVSGARFIFNNAGYAHAWLPEGNPNGRHVIAISNTQIQNFFGTSRLSSYTNNNSIAKDMLNKAGQTYPTGLNSGYEGLAFNTFILDTVNNRYFSNVDLKRTVLQTRNIVTDGHVNEWNFSYAYSSKDKYYFGASIGVPRVTYSSTTTHSEADDKDSMQITRLSPGTFTSNYISGLPAYDTLLMGFNSLTYTEFFSTSGTGVNLKLGLVARINDDIRIGFHYHSPTLYSFTDVYYNSMSATYDRNKSNVLSIKDPPDGGYFSYKIITPSKIGVSSAFTINKICVIGLEYEYINYRNAQLSSANVSDFAGVNAIIKHKYSYATNVRMGVEFNVKPVMIRAGYNMQGSPFGSAFTGSFVRHTISLGLGVRSKAGWCLDLAWYKNFSSEDYYMFSTLAQKSVINYNNAQLALTVGYKW